MTSTGVNSDDCKSIKAYITEVDKNLQENMNLEVKDKETKEVIDDGVKVKASSDNYLTESKDSTIDLMKVSTKDHAQEDLHECNPAESKKKSALIMCNDKKINESLKKVGVRSERWMISKDKTRSRKMLRVKSGLSEIPLNRSVDLPGILFSSPKSKKKKVLVQKRIAKRIPGSKRKKVLMYKTSYEGQMNRVLRSKHHPEKATGVRVYVSRKTDHQKKEMMIRIWSKRHGQQIVVEKLTGKDLWGDHKCMQSTNKSSRLPGGAQQKVRVMMREWLDNDRSTGVRRLTGDCDSSARQHERKRRIASKESLKRVW